LELQDPPQEADLGETGHSAPSHQVAQRLSMTFCRARARSRSETLEVLPRACMMAARSSGVRSNVASTRSGSRTSSARNSLSIITCPTRSWMPLLATRRPRLFRPPFHGQEGQFSIPGAVLIDLFLTRTAGRRWG